MIGHGGQDLLVQWFPRLASAVMLPLETHTATVEHTILAVTALAGTSLRHPLIGGIRD